MRRSHSNANGSCVELAALARSIGVRDSTAPGGPVLRLQRTAWVGLHESISQLWVTVRPSARRRGHRRALLASALPLARANGLDEAVIELDQSNEAGRRLIEPHGVQQIPHSPTERHGRSRYRLPTV
ncbi:DUF397 domain-containing protein [Actinomadura hibisca]|uniref:DUF397 domain-containing protein n=1 Tax=Actinomadura hibisca TaxID=68565 RepID=UPI0009FE92BE|nr:DUF397 domain-containing protein [Actinomadura hibisca]